MGRILALDVGLKRVGVAVSDPLKIIARPLATLSFTTPRNLVREVIDLVKKEEVELVVIGLPEGQADKPDGPDALALVIRDLMEKEGVVCRLVDENFTSREAEAVLHEHGKHKRQYRSKIDQIAAAVILRAFLDTLH